MLPGFEPLGRVVLSLRSELEVWIQWYRLINKLIYISDDIAVVVAGKLCCAQLGAGQQGEQSFQALCDIRTAAGLE